MKERVGSLGPELVEGCIAEFCASDGALNEP